jgi:hypothetical protein
MNRRSYADDEPTERIPAMEQRMNLRRRLQRAIAKRRPEGTPVTPLYPERVGPQWDPARIPESWLGEKK